MLKYFPPPKKITEAIWILWPFSLVGKLLTPHQNTKGFYRFCQDRPWCFTRPVFFSGTVTATGEGAEGAPYCPKTNMEPENINLEKEKHLQSTTFWVPC